MRVASWIVMLTLVKGGATVQVAAEEPAPEPTVRAPSSSPHKPHGSFRISLESLYDDNITQLSERDKDRLTNGPPSDRFLITTPDDTVLVGKADFRWIARPIRKRETTIAASFDAYRYTRNDIKNYEELGLSVTQELTASTRHLATLRGWVDRIPDFYLRQLTDDDASFAAGRRIRRAATFGRDEYGVAYGQEIVDGRLDARLGFEHQVRDYNANFDERDSSDNIWSFGLKGRPSSASKAALAAGYDTGDLRARGDLSSTPIPDDDISYRHHAVSFEAQVPWKTRSPGRLEVDFKWESRHFTTGDAFDVIRSMREDDRRDYRLRVTQRVGRRFDLVGEYRRVSKEATFPAAFESLKQVTDFVENRISLGLAWSLDFHRSSRHPIS